MMYRDLAERYSLSILHRVLAAYANDRDEIPDSDLDNEQPITLQLRCTLGDIRNARTAVECFRREK